MAAFSMLVRAVHCGDNVPSLKMLKLDTKSKRTKSGYRRDILGTGSGQKVVIGILIEFV